MQSNEVLVAVSELGAVMANARCVLDERHYDGILQTAVADAVGGISPLALTAAQMRRIAQRLQVECSS